MIVNKKIRCSRCRIWKRQSAFSPSTWKVGSGLCKPCKVIYNRIRLAGLPPEIRTLIAKKRYKKFKEKFPTYAALAATFTPKVRAARARRCKEYVKRNPEKMRHRWRVQRASPKAIAWRNKRKLRDRETLADWYVRGKLEMKNPPKQLLEAKRVLMRIKREIKRGKAT